MLNPTAQIVSILDYMRSSIKSIFGVDLNDIGVSVAFRKRGQNDTDWNWILLGEEESDIKRATRQPNSTFQNLLTKTEASHTIFYPDKKKAIEQNAYVPGKKDALHKSVGSILCRYIVTENQEPLEAVLCISTYGKQLCPLNDGDSIRKINTIILPIFETRLQLELINMYLTKYGPK